MDESSTENSNPPRERPKNTRSSKGLRRWSWMLITILVISGLIWLSYQVRDARRAVIAIVSHSPLNQISVAFHNYHDVYGCFPPAYIADEAGKPIHSWRALILPFVDGQELANQYSFDEPWDGPNNIQLANQMPRTFHVESEQPSSQFTNVVLITGPGTIFDGPNTCTFEEITDVPENTILLTETANSDIPWLAPIDLKVEDFKYTINHPQVRSPSAVKWRQPNVVFAYGISAVPLSKDIPPDVLKALTTIAGGEAITRDEAIRLGYLY